MRKTDDLMWTQLFQDRPISKETMANFHTELMVKILAHPVNFGVEIRLRQRRKWGIGLAACLMLSGFVFGVFLWLGSDVIYSGLNALLMMLSRLPYFDKVVRVGEQIVQNRFLFRELLREMSTLWGAVSWPLLGFLSVIVVFKSLNPVMKST